MKKGIIFCFFYLLVFSTYAQTEGKRDSVAIKIEYELSGHSDLLELELDLQSENKKELLTPEEVQRYTEFAKMLQYKLPEYYIGPPMEDKTLGRILPHNNDYSFRNFVPIGNNLAFASHTSRSTALTIGASTMISTSLYYQPNAWLSISGGVYGTKYNAYGYHFNDMGFDGSLRIKLHDRIYLRGHGRYAMSSHGRDMFIGPANGMGMFPQSYYGGGVEFKINDKFGIESGMMREFNPMKRKWENKPYIMPVFY